MIKYKLPVILVSFLIISLASCIKDEPLNNEADIVSATLPDADDNLQTTPTIGADRVTFRLKRFADSYEFSPEFQVTPGGTINPASGTQLDFSTPQKYTVTSQDGQWQKTYTVSFIIDEGTNRVYSFENVSVVADKVYQEFYDVLPNGDKLFDWSSGNDGYSIMAKSMAESEGVPFTAAYFPTAQTEDGYVGKGALLQTKSTGPLGVFANAPIAAGNLFIGDFVLSYSNPLKSTRFGRPYPYTTAPKTLKGYFKYKKGDDFVVHNAPSNLTEDTWNAIGILFEKVSGRGDYIVGDSTTIDPRIVMIAQVDPAQRIETDEWTPFEIPFKTVSGKSFDPNKEYMFSIILSSSLEGDKFNGALGSKLWVDEVEIVTE